MKFISTIIALVGSVLAANYVQENPEALIQYLTRVTQQPTDKVSQQPPRRSARVLEKRLQNADRASRESIGIQLDELRRFFDGASSGTQPFTETALGLASKVRLVADAIPYTRGDRHQRFLRAQFEKHIFSEQELKQALETIVQAYVDSLETIDNQLLVHLRVDIEDFPELQIGQLPQLSFEPLIANTMAHTQQSLPGDITRETISLVTAGILTRVAARLGVSAGILGTGAASSATTFGLSLAAAIVIDHLVSRLWDELADPQGKLQRELDYSLKEAFTQLEEALCDELTSLADDRARLRSATLEPLLQQ